MNAIVATLTEETLIPFSEIADRVDAVPWDVLFACRRLADRGNLREGTGKKRGSFARR